MKRLPDWQTRLEAAIVEWKGKTFQVGRADCAMWTAAAVKAMTGFDMARGLRGYRTEAEGLRKLADAGFTDHVAVAARYFSETAGPGPGDIGVVSFEGGPAGGIVQGRGIYLMSARGLVLLPRGRIERGYAV